MVGKVNKAPKKRERKIQDGGNPSPSKKKEPPMRLDLEGNT
jgi:hypothetical protein